jgi:fatty-acyl-CoA synthase
LEDNEIATDKPVSRSTANAWLRALELTAPIGREPARTFPIVIEELSQRFGGAPALLSDLESLTFRALFDRSNRYARWALMHGVRKGDTVCLLMPNRPEFMAIWVGICRAGGVVALLNSHLVGRSLAHCIDAVTPRHIIVARELLDAYRSATSHLSTNAVAWCHGDSIGGMPDIAQAIEGLSGEPIGHAERVEVTIDDRALYVYTSGTTGLPKAAIISHFRLMNWTHWFAGMMETRPTDRMYNCLPMYHSVGGAVATGAVLVNGGSVVVRDKFSARTFWEDVRRNDCTMFQYIGEMCRYLLNAHPPEAAALPTRIRLCCGNGLRGDIWEAFQQRFRIPEILEFYAATEGNITLFNIEGRPGAIGRIPSFLAHRTRLALVRFDVETGMPLRDAQGRCIRCRPNEIGEAIGYISKANDDRGARFDGYTALPETKRKILRDVFEPGDTWFRSGDLMRRDEAGFFSFVDRIGDTFRWKGENVATSEVAAAIMSFPGVTDANVYGIEIPGTDGRAGIAEIVSVGPIDLAAFRAHVLGHLPHYALPVMLRLRSEIDVTPTFKQRKPARSSDSYDPEACPDPLYLLDAERGAYVVLDRALYARLQAGGIRL